MTKKKKNRASNGKEKEKRKHLLFDTQRIDISVGDFPSVEPVWVFSMNSMKKKTQNEDSKETEVSHYLLSLLLSNLHWVLGGRENSRKPSWALSFLFCSLVGAERAGL